MSMSNKHNYITFTKNPPASLSHCAENILNQSSGKCRDSLIMGPFHQVNWVLYNFYSLISL